MFGNAGLLVKKGNEMKHVLRKYFGAISFAVIAALLVACGGGGGTPPPEEIATYAVSGVVTADGKPVRAVPISGEHDGGTAKTMSDDDGTWELSELQGDTKITADDPAYTLTAPISVSGAASGQALLLTLKECNSGSITDASNPCVITRIQQVQNIGEHLDGFFKLGADIDASETADWNDGEGFLPIGRNITDQEIPFTGTFDGAGHTIEGLVIHRPDEDSIGLFGHAGTVEGGPDQTGKIHDLVLANPKIHGKDYVGALVGDASENYIREVAIIGGSVEGKNTVGGLIGGTTAQIIIHTSSTASVTGESRVGGLIGDWDGDELTESFSNGVVSGNDKVGGLVGEAEAEIDNSYSISTVNGVGDGAKDVGGFIGYMDKNITNSFSAGEIRSEGAPAGVHGFASQNSGDAVKVYWDSEVAGVPVTGVGSPRTTEQMQKQATYVDWDFDTIWEIEEGQDYPNLRNNPR